MNKRLIITSTISIILVSILMINSTYSIFTTSDIDEESNVYTTGNLNITYTIDSNNITFSEKEPINIEDANTVIPYRITVKNEGTVPYMFDLILEDTTSTETIDYQYIMTKVGYLEPKSLSNCTDNIIKEDIILPAGETVDIDVRVWLSDTLQNTEIDKSFFAKLKVDGIAIYDKNETIDNSILSLVYMKGFEFDEENSVITGDVFYHDSTYEEYIKNISFVNYIDTTNAIESWDVSEDSDESIIAWLLNNETTGYYDLYIGSKEIIFAKNLDYFFCNMKYLDSISFDNLDTSLTESMSAMFSYSGYNSELLSLDLGDKFNTSNVTNMLGMFDNVGYNSPVFTLELGDNFNTSKVTNMQSMFANAGYNSTVFTLDLKNKFETKNVTTMDWMFYCTGYTSPVFTLNLSQNFNTSNVTSMNSMFSWLGYNSQVFTLDLGEKFNTSKVTNMRILFSNTGYSSEILTLDLGELFDTSNVEDMSGMFDSIGYSSSVFTLNLGDKFNTSKATNMASMFANVGFNNSSFTLNLGEYFNTSNVTNMSYMFFRTGYANSNFELDISMIDFTSVIDYDTMFLLATTSQKIYVKDESDQEWLLEKNFTNLSTDNILIKS